MSEPGGDPPQLLVVDDDKRIRQMLTRYFEQEGYRIDGVDGGSAMRDWLKSRTADVILLDIVLPGDDGLALAREVRAQSDVGIIMLTGRGEVVDRIVGLEVGADDYIAKPFHLREVLARVKSLLRRRQVPVVTPPPEPGEEIRFEGWCLDIGRRALVSPAGAPVDLTTGEFDLLVTLVRQPGHVFTRETLLDRTRGRNWDAFDRSVDAQIARLRKKIEGDSKSPTLIKSVRGVGYVFTGRLDRSA